ncbi:serine protease-like protein, partial [Leptotrombidium deliense]
ASNVSPASAAESFTVAASDQNNHRASFSNYGNPVDIFAPGVDCYSAKHTGGYFYISGTSMATPLVAGWAAIIKGQNPSFTNQQIGDRIIATSQPDVIIPPPPVNAVNRLLQVRC